MLEQNDITLIRHLIEDQIRAQLRYPTDPITQRTFQDLFNKLFPSINGRATGSGTTNIAASFSPTKVPLLVSTFSNNVMFDSTNSRLKILKGGQYSTMGFLYYSNPSETTKSYQTMVYKNGAAVITGYSVCSTAGIAISQAAVDILDLLPGDYLELYGQTGSTATQPVSGALSYLSLKQR